MKDKDRRALSVGSFALSTKGRDSGTVYLVIAIEGEQDRLIRVTDGRHHRLEAPKLKNAGHLLPLRVRGYLPETDGTLTNRNIRRAIRNVIDTCINNSIE